MATAGRVDLPETALSGDGAGDANSVSSLAAAPHASAAEPVWLGPLLHVMAETQRDLATRAVPPSQPPRPRTTLASAKLDWISLPQTTVNRENVFWRGGPSGGGDNSWDGGRLMSVSREGGVFI